MRTLRRLHLILVTALSFAIVFSLTAHQAHKAARALHGTVLCARQAIKFAATAPQQERFTLGPVAAHPDKTPQAFVWISALALLLLMLANSASTRQYASATRAAIAIAPQRSRFALRL